MTILRSSRLGYALGAVMGIAAAQLTMADDWAGYRGSRGDATAAEAVAGGWPSGGPRLIWRVPTPAGFGSFSVAEGRVFTLVARTNEGSPAEICLALDAATGKELWTAPVGLAKYPGGGDSGAPGNRGGDGPRSTPAVSGGKVYVYSSDMVLHCLDAATGKPVWKHDILHEYAGRNIGWNSALSPVVDGGLVFVAGGGPGQSLLAFNQASGALAWKTGDEKMTHATPVVATLHGMRQVIFLMQSGLVAVEAGKGTPLWRFPHPYRTATACSPVVSGEMVFCTAGYEVGGAACQVLRKGEGFEARELWRIKGNNQVASLWSTPVARDGHLYGMISFKRFGSGPLKCVDLKTGAVKWEQPGFGAGNVILAGEHLVALSDDGQVVLVKAHPDAFLEIARFKAVQGKCWSTPALSGGRLFVRSTVEGACFDLSGGR